MPRKRTSAEANNDEQTDDSSESIQREGDAKRAKLDPGSDTTLQDLPLELLEGILVKTVLMEVKGLKLAKSVWKGKADLVISRLRPVCSQWRDILTTNSFRAKLHRILDSTAQTIRLKILQESSIHSRSEAMTTLKDEIFLLYKQLDGHYVIKVYNRDNMEEVKDVIPLPGTDAQLMTGCNVSNCVYISLRQGDSLSLEVLRISRDAEQKFNVSPWINDRRMMSVSANGSLIIYSRLGGRHRDVVRIYKANGSLQHEIKLPRDIRAWEYKNVIQKSNGNLVLAYVGIRDDHVTLTEVDLSGSAVRQFQSSIKHTEKSFVDVADESDRLMIAQTIRLEVLQESSIHSQNEAMTTLKDEIILLYKQRDGHYLINVYNRDNMQEVNEVIPLPEQLHSA